MNSLTPERSPFALDYQRYWNRLSPREREMRLTEEGLYSLALQPIMEEIAESIRGETVLDAFCGFGGSAIGLARAGKKVIAVDLDPTRIEAARYNARLFGVEKLISFYVGDARKLMVETCTDAIFLDPPWGGPGYIQKRKFSLSDFEPDGRQLLSTALSSFECVALRTPRNFDFTELGVFSADVPVCILANSFLRELLHFTAIVHGEGCSRLLRELTDFTPPH